MEKKNKLTNKAHSPEKKKKKNCHSTGEKFKDKFKKLNSAENLRQRSITSMKKKRTHKTDIIINGKDGKIPMKGKKV